VDPAIPPGLSSGRAAWEHWLYGAMKWFSECRHKKVKFLPRHQASRLGVGLFFDGFSDLTLLQC
jgi:hypothetical protein